MEAFPGVCICFSNKKSFNCIYGNRQDKIQISDTDYYWFIANCESLFFI